MSSSATSARPQLRARLPASPSAPPSSASSSGADGPCTPFVVIALPEICVIRARRPLPHSDPGGEHPPAFALLGAFAPNPTAGVSPATRSLALLLARLGESARHRHHLPGHVLRFGEHLDVGL